MKNSFLRLKLAIREDPATLKYYYIYKENKWLKRRVLRPYDDALIEGYPRSSNTFATYAFKYAQKVDTYLGNHFHSSGQFVLANKYHIPEMLVIREPIAAIKSFMLFSGNMDVKEALIRYIAFHQPLLALQKSFSVAPFEEVTSDFGKSILRMNSKFGTTFKLFEHTPENVERVFEQISMDRARRAEQFGKFYRDPMKTTIPTAEKDLRKADLEYHFKNPSSIKLQKRAYALYKQILSSL